MPGFFLLPDFLPFMYYFGRLSFLLQIVTYLQAKIRHDLLHDLFRLVQSFRGMRKKKILLKRSLNNCNCGPTPGFRIDRRFYVCCDLCFERSPFFEQVTYSEFLTQNNLYE